MRSKSIFTKIILIILIAIVPVFLYGIYGFARNQEVIEELYYESIKKQVSAYFRVQEGDINEMIQHQLDILNDEDIGYMLLAASEDFSFEIGEAINRLQRRLLYFKDSNNYIEETRIILPSLEKEIYVSGRMVYDDIDAGHYEDLLKKRTVSDMISAHEDDIYIITTTFNYNDVKSDYKYMILSKFSKSYILEDIKNYEINDEALSGLYFYDFDLLLADTEDEGLLWNVINSGLSETMVKIDGVRYLLVSYEFEGLNAYYYQLIPRSTILAIPNSFRFWYLLYIAVVIIVFSIISINLYNQIKKPVDKLIAVFGELETGSFNQIEGIKRADEFAVVYHSFNRMVVKLEQLVNDVYVQKILIQKAQLRQLQAQINPHFLYNSFFALKQKIAKQNYDDSVAFCDMLGKYFKYMTKNFDDYARLEEEINYAKIYTEIQVVRFGDRITAEFMEFPDEFKDVSVPKLIVQPLIENAYKYALENMEFDGYLRVSYEKSGGYIYIYVEDNGENPQENIKRINKVMEKEVQIDEPSALINIRRRIKLFYGDESGMTVSQSELGGVKVTLKLKMQEGK